MRRMTLGSLVLSTLLACAPPNVQTYEMDGLSAQVRTRDKRIVAVSICDSSKEIPAGTEKADTCLGIEYSYSDGEPQKATVTIPLQQPLLKEYVSLNSPEDLLERFQPYNAPANER